MALALVVVVAAGVSGLLLVAKYPRLRDRVVLAELGVGLYLLTALVDACAPALANVSFRALGLYFSLTLMAPIATALVAQRTFHVLATERGLYVVAYAAGLATVVGALVNAELSLRLGDPGGDIGYQIIVGVVATWIGVLLLDIRRTRAGAELIGDRQPIEPHEQQDGAH